MVNIESFTGKYIVVELMITRKCSFHCEHCMYDCGSKESSEYMSDEVLSKVKKQVDFLKEIGMDVCVNLVGGEPTINFDKYARIVDEVMTWNVSFMMTTNGWWLGSKKNIDRFFEVISKYAPVDGSSASDGFSHKGFTIRISDDPFHRKERKVKNIDKALYKIFNDEELIKKYNIPMPDIKTPWIWRQIYDERYYIAPNGRGKNVTNIDEWIKKYSKDGSFCIRDVGQMPNIHYEPDGKISDACGLGSMYDFGTVDDNILFIINIILCYKHDRYTNKDLKTYTCLNCREMVHEWKEKYLEKYRTYFSFMNTFDVEKFAQWFS